METERTPHPDPLPIRWGEGGIFSRATYPGWRSFLAYPGLLSYTPNGVFEMARSACAEICLRRSACRSGQTSTYTASLGRATELRLCEREARGVVIGSAKRSDIDVARVNGGGGPRRRAERGGACPPPPSIVREALTLGGRGVLAEPAPASLRGRGTRRAASAGAGETLELLQRPGRGSWRSIGGGPIRASGWCWC